MIDALKSLIKTLAADLIVNGVRSAVEIVEIKAVAIYLKIVDAARKSLIAVIALFLVMLLLLVGFVAIHVGVFIVSGWQLRTIGIISLILGFVYCLLAIVLILRITSEKTWMKLSHGTELVEKVTRGR